MHARRIRVLLVSNVIGLVVIGFNVARQYVPAYCDLDDVPTIVGGQHWPDGAKPDATPTFEYEGRRWFHPGAWSAAAHALIDVGRIREAEQLADALWMHQHGGWLAYDFDWPVTNQDAPWYSAMDQGRSLGVFARLGQMERAEVLYETLLPGSPVVNERGWLLEYPGFPPVLNGAIVGTFGIYDYWEATGDPAVRNRLELAVLAIARDVHRFRTPSGISSYDIDGLHHHLEYHHAHVDMLRALSSMASMPCLDRAADDFDNDA
jgi:hypothetical protein